MRKSYIASAVTASDNNNNKNKIVCVCVEGGGVTGAPCHSSSSALLIQWLLARKGLCVWLAVTDSDNG